MWRIVHGAALVAGPALALAACGGRPAPTPDEAGGPEASLTAAVLSQRDMPPGFLPAEDQQVFWGVRPSDPDCAGLLALADLRGLRDMPQVHAAFYNTAPVATLVEHVVRLPAGQAARRVGDVRQAAAMCPAIRVGVGERRMDLVRTRMRRPFGVWDAYAVRYRSRPRERPVHFDVFVVRVRDYLLVVAHPAMADRPYPPGWGAATERIAARAARKLRATLLRGWDLPAPPSRTPPASAGS